MRRRLTLLLVAAGAAGSLAAGPVPPIDPQLPDPEDYDPFPLGVCAYVRPVNPNTEYCVIVRDPR